MDKEVFLVKKMIGEIALIITAIAGLITAVFHVAKWIWGVRKELVAKKQKQALHNMSLIEMLVEKVGNQIGAHKAVIGLMHNGGDMLNPSTVSRLTLLEEFLFPLHASESNLLKASRRNVRNRELGRAKKILCSLPSRKVLINDVKAMEESFLKDIFLSQHLKTVIMIYLGMNSKGMHFLSFGFQIEGIDRLTPQQRTDTRDAVEELKKLFDLR